MLGSGTWVSTAGINTEVLLETTAPPLDDLLLVDEGRDALGLLVIPRVGAASHPAFMNSLRAVLFVYNSANPVFSH